MATEPITYPPVIINEYLSEKIDERLSDRFAGPLRFFPTLPTDINAITEGSPEESADVFAVYDRMFKMRRSPFPHIKSEQLLYYFYKSSGDPEALIETSQVVSDLLDREDESAEEINQWIASKAIGGVLTFGSGSLARDFKPVRFHSFKVYQLEETRDTVSFDTVHTYSTNKIIIEYKYHTQNYS
jgi:hypothetical protein